MNRTKMKKDKKKKQQQNNNYVQVTSHSKQKQPFPGCAMINNYGRLRVPFSMTLLLQLVSLCIEE